MKGSLPVLGHPALRRLARMKLKAKVRSIRRRLSTPSGCLFGGVGLLLMLLWFGTLIARGWVEQDQPIRPRADPRQLELLARGTLAMFTMMVVLASLAHRGLYLPQGEIERLLSAPVSRVDLVRYRMLSNLARSVLFGIISGLLVAPRMPHFVFAYPATFLAMLTVPVLGQAFALVFGDAENRLGRVLSRVPPSVPRIVLAVIVWAAMMLFLFDPPPASGLEHDPFEIGPTVDVAARAEQGWRSFLSHPTVVWLTLPFAPWAKAISAGDLGTFLPWFGLSIGLFLVLFELTARIPIDFRELSLETSADVARRMRLMRSGQNAISGARVSKRALARRVPWIFGRTPFGAVAWLKCCSIFRKARGTLLFALIVTALATFAATELFPDPFGGALFIALLGTLYLGSGLRFDFRADLDLMEIIKVWPLRPWKIFLATILPGALLLTVLIEVAILARSPLLAWRADVPFDVALGPRVLGVMAGVPLVSILWVALDNAVFLVMPVRFVPGQSGAMQHTGRTMVMLVLRLLLLAVLAFSAWGLAFATTFVATEWFGASAGIALWLASCAAMLVVMLGVGALLQAGAWALARFDVSRERILTG
ncbi:MAG: hypothetical protein GY711_26865 [bacterium]|nr:hypothetical protein [bacterium]